MLNRTEAVRRKPNQQPPGNYCHCACSRLHNQAITRGLEKVITQISNTSIN